MAKGLIANPFTTRTFADDETVEAIESFFVDGIVEMIPKGKRLRGDNLAVRKAPQLFIRLGAADEELKAQRETVLHAHSNEVAAEADRALREEQRRREPPPIPIERRLRVRDSFRLGLGRTFGAGEIVDREDKAIAKIVSEHPQFFEIPGRPLA